jgi:hypothetical protein
LYTVAGEESEKGEDDEWESQQIRKGVTGAQVSSWDVVPTSAVICVIACTFFCYQTEFVCLIQILKGNIVNSNW